MSEQKGVSERKGEAQHVLVAVTGSVAAIKVPELVKQLTLQQETKVNRQIMTLLSIHWTGLLDDWTTRLD